jgi:hypothetical protein
MNRADGSKKTEGNTMDKRRMEQAQRLYSRPDASAITDTWIAQGEEFEIGKEVKRNGVGFYEVRRQNGQTGYIPSETHVAFPVGYVIGAPRDDEHRRMGMKDLKVGGFWCVAGGAATAATLAAGGPVGIFGAALAFGVIRLCRGIGRVASQ